MRFASLLIAALTLACFLAPTSASAQRTLGYDTISGESPVAVTCGFCAGERFGVIYRDLPAPSRGLEPEDFPIELEAIQLSLAAANAIGSGSAFTCRGSTTGGEASVGIAIFSGISAPTEILTLDAVEPWPGETLVWTNADVPVMRSVADEEGSASYEVDFNRFLLQDEAGLPFRVEAPNVYIRVVVTLNSDTALTSIACEGLSLDTPSGFAVRDNNGVIEPERNMLFADGLGWYWNEAFIGGTIGGDWAIRLEIRDLGAGPATDSGAPPGDSGSDGGPGDPDASSDAGGAGDAADAGPEASSGGGCETAGAGPGAGSLAILIGVAALIYGRRRRGTL